MNYASVRTCDIANGEGVRVSLFVSGCTHRCKGCFNEEAQDFAYGQPFTAAVEDEILEALAPSHIAGLTLLGGEPMEPANQRALAPFLRRFRARYGATKTLWIYTGCVYEQLKVEEVEKVEEVRECGSAADQQPATRHQQPSYWRTEVTDEILAMTDVLVDGPFVEDLKDISLRFRGSSNQRILELRKIENR